MSVDVKIGDIYQHWFYSAALQSYSASPRSVPRLLNIKQLLLADTLF